MKAGLNTADLSVAQIRELQNSAPTYPTPDNVEITQVSISRTPVAGLEEDASGDFPAEWIEKKGLPSDAPVLIYYHGGGYCIMSPLTHRSITVNIALEDIRVLSVDYRMGPEHPYPAAVVDAVNAVRFVLASGVPASKIVLSGDSAGGGLTIATALYLRDQDVIPQVAGTVAISPWVDLSGNSPTIALGEEFLADIIGQGRDSTKGMVDGYAPGELSLQPLASPIHDRPKSDRPLPPCVASLATVDRLFGEDIVFTTKRIEAGEILQVDVYQEQLHVFQFFPFLAQTATFHKRTRDFVHTITSGGSVSTSVNWVDATGAVSPIADGVADLKSRLKKYLDRVSEQGLAKGRSDKELEDYAIFAEIMAVKAMKAEMSTTSPSIAEMREVLKATPVYPTPDDVEITQVCIPRTPVTGLEEDASGNFPAEWIEKKGSTKDLPVVIYYHGGGYCIMSPLSVRSITINIALQDIRVLSVDYRMGPEHPYPAAVVDGVNSIKFVLASGVPASKIVLSGDSGA
ncbi:hypothetical protein HDU93_006021 [Gonapodya sp. JEL0774]|nr:hypothetical protein HDU93_006021 [Gonapodya sp. JEL0774]